MLNKAMPSLEQTPATIQSRTLRTFTVLHTLRPDWGGALILACGLNSDGAALALASNIAGAVCLSLEDDPAVAHNALRSGACDFVVNTLDEALRAMKNEVRKHLPLSVGLQGDTTQILGELLERGIAPQLFTNFTEKPHETAAASLKASGTIMIDFLGRAPGEPQAENLLQSILIEKQWHLEAFPHPTSSSLRAFDERAIEILPRDDKLRRKWLHSASRILPRELPPQRTLWLTQSEKQLLQNQAT
jgi:urocanate hydratase